MPVTTQPRTSPYGTWDSPITPRTVAEQGVRLGFVALDGDDVYWLEGRPREGGRNVLVRRGADGTTVDVTPREHNVRTRVHEYGGGAFLVADSVVYYSNFADQRIYRIRLAAGVPEPITPPGDWFYADAAIDSRRRRLICVREDHTQPGREPVTTLVAIALDEEPGPGISAQGSGIQDRESERGYSTAVNQDSPASAGEIIASGADFYSTPRVSADGTKLAWLEWRHPRMPWDGTELWVAEIAADGTLANAALVAGAPLESIYQPGWSPDGALYFASDRTGWWQLYRVAPGGFQRPASGGTPVLRDPPAGSEFGRPQWLFGWATWACAGERRLVVSYAHRGRWTLATVDPVAGTLLDLHGGFEPLEWLAATETHAVYVAASPTAPAAVVRTDLSTGVTVTLRSSSTQALDPRHLSISEAIEFPTAGGLTAHAFHYPPRNGDFTGPPSERPPLIVISHGGPTTQTKAMLDPQVQYWTSRGFAVVDVNYGGSSGYGRAYRERLNGQWGIVDVDDCINVARYLVGQGKADPRRLVIRGGSAGGYTTLAALAFHPEVFAAGASYYGVSDAEALATDTHKFESRYLDTLIGPYPADQAIYRERSPIHFVDRLSCALILFQGLEDKVVPPSQSQKMADAVRAKGLPVAYITFEGEQHGFRKSDTIVRCLESELSFYGAVFGFTPAGALTPVRIENMP